MAIFQSITPHLLSPLSLPSHQHYYVLPLSHTSVMSLLICPSSVDPSLASLLSPAYCVNVNFTLLMFITSITVSVLSGLQDYMYC